MALQGRDEMWLKQADAKKYLTEKKFYLYTEIENRVTACIRSEIQEYFGAKLISKKESADIVISIVNKQQFDLDSYEIVVSDQVEISSESPQGALYGLYTLVFDYIQTGSPRACTSNPTSHLRFINHWDNFDGSIERGYAGNSIFYQDNQFLDDVDTIRTYARLLASVGVNAIALNNVNVKKEEMHFLVQPYLKHIKLMALIFEEYGIKSYLCVNFASPIGLGNLPTADPLDPEVAAWWQETIDNLYQIIPTFGGLVVKADSEGEPGPYEYGRTQADGANTLAAPLAKHGGLLIWRAFVYNCRQDWRDRKTDRAKASYETFMELDGQFAENVVLQIKFGPHDFQVGEVPHPLFGQLQHTNEIIEFQITQEYTGQQIDLNYLAPQWQEILEFNTDPTKEKRAIKYVIEQDSPTPDYSGFAAVVNVGADHNWTGNKLAQSNLYAYGRMAWNYQLKADEILTEWINQTFSGLSQEEKNMIGQILSDSNATYENYTSPLGIGWMVNSKNAHYGPGLNDHEYSRWGTYHFADRNGLGVDRTLEIGTGYTGQYSDAVCRMFNDLSSCPDRWLLFFHHVPYTHLLDSGKTVIQHIYDTHFAGVERVEEYIKQWYSLNGKLPAHDYENVALRLDMQLKNAIEWRDQINTFFYRFSGIADEKGRNIYQ
ncbi:MAG: alpha-glucuronidase [Lachnospiraceae bacterium]